VPRERGGILAPPGEFGRDVGESPQIRASLLDVPERQSRLGRAREDAIGRRDPLERRRESHRLFGALKGRQRGGGVTPVV
jgi:hypothetical protein